MTLKAIPQRPWLYYELILSDNLIICPVCNGTGANPEYADLNLDLFNAQVSLGRNESLIIFVYCSKCYGVGYMDWVKSMTGLEPGDYDDLFTSLKWNCIEFLFMTLAVSPKDYIEGIYSESGGLCHVVYGKDLDVDYSLINFNKYKSIVSNYLEDKDRDLINCIINKAMIINGKACTNCLKLVPDKVLIERCKKTLKLLPAMPDDEVNYQNFIVPDRDFPLFRLCDTCNQKLTKYEINQLKEVAFDKNNNMNPSKNFYNKISAFNYSESYI
jgi:hypothetical protein